MTLLALRGRRRRLHEVAGTWQRFLPLLLSLPAACGTHSDGPCNVPTCEYGVNTVHLERGTIDWAIGGALAQSANVASQSQPTGECQLTVIPGKISNPTNPPTWLYPGATRLKIECALGGTAADVIDGGAPLDGGTQGPYWSMTLHYAADPRSWTAGQTVLLETGELEYCKSVGTDTVPERLSIFVEEAVGGAADFPAIVTADYRRVFRIEYTTPGRWPSAATDCVPDALVKVTLRLVQTAVDFSFEHGVCAKCA
jgi:hypothetical protein